MTKREGELKSQFRREMKKQLPGFLMLQYATAGAPDRAIIGLGRTTNWEFKHGTPDFVSHGDQELMCARIDAVSHCRYVIWYETHRGESQRTLIVRPRDVLHRTGWLFDPIAWCRGFDMHWLVGQIREAHV